MPWRGIDLSLPCLDPDALEPLETPRSPNCEERGKLVRANSAGASSNHSSSASARNSGTFGVQMDGVESLKRNSISGSQRGKLRRSATGLVVIHSDGRTLLHDAVMRGDIPKVKQFLGTGCTPNALTKGEMTPLHFAAIYKRTAIAQLLMDQLARIELQDDRGLTALHLAAEYEASPIVDMLVNKSAMVDAKDHLDNTALHVAALKGNCRIIGYLLDAGADANGANVHGYTPLGIAEECSTIEVVEQLQAGGDPQWSSADRLPRKISHSFSSIFHKGLATVARSTSVLRGGSSRSKSATETEGGGYPLSVDSGDVAMLSGLSDGKRAGSGCHGDG